MPINWNELIKIAGPLAGEIAGHGERGAFMSGFQRAQQRAEQKKQQQDETAQRMKATGADYLLKIGEHAQGLQDPIDFENFLHLADQAGTKAGYLQPGEARSAIQFNGAKQGDAQLKELAAELAKLEGGTNPFDLDELAQTGATIKLKNGKSIPVSAAIQLTQARPQSATGEAIARPKKSDTAPGTDYERSLARYARGLGKTVGQLTTAEEFAFKQQEKAATAAPADLEADQLNKTLKQLQIDRLRNPPAKKDGPTDAQAFSMEERLAKAWNSANQSAREMNRQYGLMTTGLKRFQQGDKNGGSQAVLVTFQKILDPTSVVRESEYARTAVGQSLLNRMEGSMDKLASGGAGMTGPELSAMVETARQFVANMKDYTAGQRRRIENQAKTRKLDPASIFDDVLTGATDPAASAQQKLGGR